MTEEKERIIAQMKELMESIPPGDEAERDHLEYEMEILSRQH
jgi:hypothetical protein